MLNVWDAESGEELRRFDFVPAAFTTVCFSPDDTTVISGHTDSLVRFWHLWSLEDLKKQAQESSYHLSEVERCRFGLPAKESI